MSVGTRFIPPASSDPMTFQCAKCRVVFIADEMFLPMELTAFANRMRDMVCPACGATARSLHLCDHPPADRPRIIKGAAKLDPALRAWLETGRHGLSSLQIVQVLEGYPPHALGTRPGRDIHEPRDAEDVVRCELLLRAVPSVRAKFRSMRRVSAAWGRLVDAWPEIIATLTREVPGWDADAAGRAPQTNALIRRALDG